MLENVPLKNHWHWLRHGQSMANVANVIASNPATAVDGFGLSSIGQQQVYHTMTTQRILGPATQIITSDFLRARETAEIASECIKCHLPLIVDRRLRERSFGELEGTSSANYEKVWRLDALDPENKQDYVESCTMVASRLSALVMSFENSTRNSTFLLVSHGDPLQILECCFKNRPVEQHRQLEPLHTAELRSHPLPRLG